MVVLLVSSAASVTGQDKGETDFWGGGHWGGGGWWGNEVTYSGRGTVVNAFIAEHRTIVADTGELPSTGGIRNVSTLDVNIPGTLTATVAHAATIGHGNRTRAESSLAMMNLNVAGQTITADMVMARAVSRCDRDNAVAHGISELVNLAINGVAVTVSGEPNQVIEVPGLGTITINEQITTDGANSTGIVVNALHITAGTSDIIIGHAKTGVSCGTPGCTGSDFISGHGFIQTANNSRARFGFVAGMRGSTPHGHIAYMDHGANVRLRGFGITSYTNTGAGSRRIVGRAALNGQQVTYTLNVTDNGSPGTGDTFALQVSNGYNASGNLVRGDIHLHEPCGK